MDDDFNTGGAMGELFELAKQINKYCDAENLDQTTTTLDVARRESLLQMMRTWKELANILGLFHHQPMRTNSASSQLLDPLLQLIITIRTAARGKKDFATADLIRDGLEPIRIVLEDRPSGTEWTGGGADSTSDIMQLVIKIRAAARTNKDFATADLIRDHLDHLGIQLEDRPDGTEWTAT